MRIMNKEKKYYLISWILLVALFNIICFVTPSELYGYDKYAGAFWPGYGFIMLTFVIHLAFTMSALSADGSKKKILNAPLIVIGFFEILIMVVVGGACMAIPGISYWVGIIACAVILVLSIVFMLGAKVVGENTYNANITLNANVSLFRDITAEAETLMTKANTQEAKTCAKKIVDAVRYSDPMSDVSLASEEHAIQAMIREISAIIGNNSELAQINTKTAQLLELIEMRNLKCKANKRNRV